MVSRDLSALMCHGLPRLSVGSWGIRLALTGLKSAQVMPEVLLLLLLYEIFPFLQIPPPSTPQLYNSYFISAGGIKC